MTMSKTLAEASTAGRKEMCEGMAVIAYRLVENANGHVFPGGSFFKSQPPMNMNRTDSHIYNVERLGRDY